jgi:hypothetical protein
LDDAAAATLRYMEANASILSSPAAATARPRGSRAMGAGWSGAEEGGADAGAGGGASTEASAVTSSASLGFGALTAFDFTAFDSWLLASVQMPTPEAGHGARTCPASSSLSPLDLPPRPSYRYFTLSAQLTLPPPPVFTPPTQVCVARN